MTGPIAAPQFKQTFASTRGGAQGVDLATAVISGPAPDGGLWVPETLTPFTASECDWLERLPFQQMATEVMHRLLGTNLEREQLQELISSALDFDIPLRQITTPTSAADFDARSLNLFLGPTLAFKDVGARFMARLLRWAREQTPSGSDRELEILVATSGDTGSAVAQAFLGLEGFTVTVLFPKGQVSEAQRKLFTTLGQNTRSFAVDGTFDDCQRLVKAAFADVDLRQERDLGSANSINIARLLPQSLYYFWVRSQLTESERARPLVICVPSGNFGNLTAGLLAQRLGLRVDRWIAATNSNDVVPSFLDGDDYSARPSVPTLANAMDVGDPSNFERIRWLYEHDEHAIRSSIGGARATDEEIQQTMRRVLRDTGDLLDPHTAIGYLACEQDWQLRAHAHNGASPSAPIYAFLATAHPSKFEDVVKKATGEAVALPKALRSALERSEAVTEIEPDYAAFRAELVRS